VEIPISCSLDAADARSQVDEWQVLLGAHVVTVEWSASTTLNMRLDATTDPAALFALAQREVDCCPFFRFAVEVDDRGLGLVVQVPADAISILQNFAQFAST
jgi:hypothetical protein